MLDIKFIRNNPEKVLIGAKNKGVDVDVDFLLELDSKRKDLIQKTEEIKSKKNKANEKIKSSNEKEKKEVIEEMRGLGEKEDKLNQDLKKINEEFNFIMKSIPCLPLDNVIVGKDDKENVVAREEGTKRCFEFTPKDYLEIAENLDIIDVKRAAKVSGSRFGYLKKEAAILELALIQLAFNKLIDKGFVPVFPPVMIKPEMMEKMGYIEKNKEDEWVGDDAYFLKNDDLILTATSEQSIGPMHQGETFDSKELPKRYVAFSNCFRREAGSYGKDTKGILRVHQFDKIEMFGFCLPEESIKEHQLLLSIEEEIMNSLKLPYRVIDICTGDLGMPAASKYDIEAWMPGQNEYRETHSTSNCLDFQSRRLDIRYRKNDGSTDFVHTVNGTAVAVGRILISIIENYQQKDGSFDVPEVLQKYTGFKKIEKR